MDIQDWALVASGSIGAIVAVIHGIILQKRMMPLIIGQSGLPAVYQRLIPVLLHFSTFCWFFGGVVLAIAPFYFTTPVKTTITLFVGFFYAFGAIGNFWGTHGKHPGWILLAVAVALIVFGII